jgi:hypothetical protein
MSKLRALGLHTVHKSVPVLDNDSVDGHKDGSDSTVQVDDLRQMAE